MDDLIGLIALLVIIFSVIGNIIKRFREAISRGGAETWADMTPVERRVQQELERRLQRKRGGEEPPVAPEPLPTFPDASPAPQSPPPRPAPERPPVVVAEPAAPRPVTPLRPVMREAHPAPAPRPAAQRHTAPRSAAQTPRRTAPVTAAAPQRRPLRITAKTMARIAILSEVWRTPVALRRDEPWERY